MVRGWQVREVNFDTSCWIDTDAIYQMEYEVNGFGLDLIKLWVINKLM